MRLSISLGSPAVIAGVRRSVRSMPFSVAWSRREASTPSTTWARSRVSQRVIPRSLVARTSSASDEPLLVSAEGERLLAGRAQGAGVGVGVGEGDFEEGAQPGEGGPQFVGGVGDEVALGVEGGLKAGEQVVEGAAEFCQLVGGFAEVEAPAEVAGGDGFGGGGDGAQRVQEPAGDEPAESQRDGKQDDEGDGGSREELGQADPVPGSGDRRARRGRLWAWSTGRWRAGRRRVRARRPRQRRCPPRRRARAGSARTFWRAAGRS